MQGSWIIGHGSTTSKRSGGYYIYKGEARCLIWLWMQSMYGDMDCERDDDNKFIIEGRSTKEWWNKYLIPKKDDTFIPNNIDPSDMLMNNGLHMFVIVVKWTSQIYILLLLIHTVWGWMFYNHMNSLAWDEFDVDCWNLTRRAP